MSDLLAIADQFVFNHFNEHTNKNLFHNYSHTMQVVNSCKVLAKEHNCSEEALQDLLIAAYFHDTGYVNGAEGHEERGVAICDTFLTNKGVDATRISIIKSLILATEKNAQPEVLLEQIIRDADCSHIIRKDFLDYSDLLRREVAQINGTEISSATWLEENVGFFNSHKFYSPFAKENWRPIKEQTLFKIFKEKDKIQKKETQMALPEKGVETAFRVALKNHMKLSDIADAKANILLSVNAIIISVALSTLVPKLDNPSNGYLIYPTVILIGFSVIVIVFSILSTRPKGSSGSFTREDIRQKKVNLLFFGNFHNVSLEDYDWGMNEMMKDREYLYGSMIKDLYFLGKVLHKKYHLLKITYNIFLVGLLVSIMSFALMFHIAA
ncbi:Pycsar system effector family protein [Patiriisocius sp. Uisw_017]|jgi:predicted metal-dependent HD superfamily phosphohydrolase|uniref:Pycsar system effector family protein n=1 Tax=Patiriisocius sp. Uisw_017 TaxID=3230968 RepID=UPI0039EB5595